MCIRDRYMGRIQMKKKEGPNPNEEMYLTGTEARRLKQAISDPQFQQYFDEYLREVTDPAGRKEREEYILQQAEKNDLPPNTILVRPEAGFCIKSYTRRLLTTQGVKKYVDQKLFINICGSSHMEPPQKIEVTQDGKKMAQWSLPYTCLLYTSPSPRDLSTSRMPSSA
eukprot:TRINITY_DN51335_c0_g1_i1.p2 TRINITY_DN51335_c0_g1~~TRINITY_DN51335_c0_g1_i1.p2  ORF type:complete len:168 (+),score=35.36 TRINITY_DN51335_c0_g1_i1:111-614(+)